MNSYLLNNNKIMHGIALWLSGLFLVYAQATFGAPHLSDDERAFLAKHWPLSISAQGEAPESYSELEASLLPESCGTCHVTQYKDWKTSLHGNAMGPGVLGQIIGMEKNDPETAKLCLSCHAPLMEQQRKLSAVSGLSDSRNEDNPIFSKKLQHEGLVCASCHVRNHQRFGPPRKDTVQVSGEVREKELPHGGFATQTAFGKSAFCKTCHQFEPEGYSLNGKLFENTYNEWVTSNYSEKGVECQNCHMPNRKHSWRGIHDEEMVKNGIDVTVEVSNKVFKINENFTAQIKITNSRVGHNFPTYITPKVFIRGYFLNKDGQIIEDTKLEAAIGREVSMDLSEELYDTRIPPHETLTIVYSQPLSRDSVGFKVEVIVEPDHFYERFYKSMLSGGLDEKVREMMEEALLNTQKSVFSIFEKEFKLNTDSKVALLPSKVVEKNNVAKITNKSGEKNDIKSSHLIDWNDNGIEWLGYDEGKRYSEQLSKPMMLIFYADWCPTCHAYKQVFYDPAIVAAAKNFIMVRANVDEYPELSDAYQYDGDYVPRTFVFESDGDLLNTHLDPKAGFKYFLPNNVEVFLSLMKRTSEAGTL